MAKQVQIINATISLPDIIRVAAYVRVSSKSDDQLHSYHTQYSYYNELIQSKKDWILADIYADEGLTGTRADKRDEFNRLMADCRNGKIDRILVKTVSRFARNVADCLKNIRELKRYGVSVYFEEEGIDTKEMTDETILSIRSVQAQHESVINSKSARWSYTKRMQAGEFITTHAPYGYICDGKSGLIIDIKTAPTVRWMFSAYLDGKGSHTIAAELNRKGIPSPDGSVWSSSGVKRILKNEKYTGNALLQKTYTTESLPFTQKRNHGEMPQYYIEGSHEAIVSQEVYNRVQELISWRQSYYTGEKHNSIYPLSLKIICQSCGSSFRRKVLTKGAIVWECHKHNNSAEECPIVSIREQEVYMGFVNLYNRLKKNYRYILLPMQRYLQQLYRPPENVEHEIADINNEIAKVSKKLTRIYALFEKGALNEMLFMKNKQPLEQEVYTLRKQRTMLLKNENTGKIQETEKIIRLLEAGPTVITDFNPLLFENMVQKVIVGNENKIGFRLTKDLILWEEVDRSKRR